MNDYIKVSRETKLRLLEQLEEIETQLSQLRESLEEDDLK